jgi:23S rRNA (cytosine1962-C5)-methyltransferase
MGRSGNFLAIESILSSHIQTIVPYQLVDFGNGRKLESFGDYLVDRPSPAAESARPSSDAWPRADARFEAENKTWSFRRPFPESMLVDAGGFVMPIRPTPFGHLGWFPEQAENWRWLQTTVNSSSDRSQRAGLEALNLFAYTGASTMALVSSGFRVTHVDAAKPNVAAANAAAHANGWTEPPIRFIVDDAMKYSAREIRRGRRYHTIVMDPPAYGHGPDGRAWRLERDVWPLIDQALDLINQPGGRILITGHTETVDEKTVRDYLRAQGPQRRPDWDWATARYRIGRSCLESKVGRRLDAGFFVRFEIGLNPL